MFWRSNSLCPFLSLRSEMSEWVKGRCLRIGARPILKFEARWQSRWRRVTVTLQQNHGRGEFHAKVFKFDTCHVFQKLRSKRVEKEEDLFKTKPISPTGIVWFWIQIPELACLFVQWQKAPHPIKMYHTLHVLHIPLLLVIQQGRTGFQSPKLKVVFWYFYDFESGRAIAACGCLI